MRFDPYMRIHIVEPVPGRFDFWSADVPRAMEELAVQIGDVDRVKIDESNRSNSRGREVHRGRRTEASRPDQQHARRSKTCLSFFPDFGKRYLAGVALTLFN